MARGSPTDADRVLVDHLAGFGYPVKAATLEYWRGQGALPPRIAPGRGRGRGRGSEDPPETAELALGICRFLDKSRGILDRPDLPRRRRVAEAPLWLWYERYPIANKTIRDAVGAYFLGLSRRLGAGSSALAAVEAEVAGMYGSELFRGQVRAFQRLGGHPGERPIALAESATSQFLQALQGDVEVEASVFPMVFEYPLVSAGAIDELLTTAPDAQAIATTFAIEGILQKITCMTPDDWRDIREVLRSLQNDVSRLATDEDPIVRRTARTTPLANSATRFVEAIGALAVSIETLRKAVNQPSETGRSR